MLGSGEHGLSGIEYPDEAFNSWGASGLGIDPLEASFTSLPYQPVRPHVPFYRFVAYPDILDLRRAGYEMERFTQLFDLLENVRYQDALKLGSFLRKNWFGEVWNPRRAQEIEFQVRVQLSEFGYGELPNLFRRFLGKAFPADAVSQLTIDLVELFYWASLAVVARDLAWRNSELAWKSDYLEFPLNVVLGWQDG
jgi:hypothetical protein